MLSQVIRPAREIIRALVAGDSTRQLAAGFSLGTVVLLAPHGNLIAVSLCVLLFSLRVNGPAAPTAAEGSESPQSTREEACP